LRRLREASAPKTFGMMAGLGLVDPSRLRSSQCSSFWPLKT
jgi:hypothetical protein